MSEVKLKVRSKIFNRFGDSEISIFSEMKPEKSKTDQTYYRSQEDIIADFITTGKALQEMRQSVYDFKNGNDNGSKIPITRDTYEHDLSDVSQEIRDTAKNVNMTPEEVVKTINSIESETYNAQMVNNNTSEKSENN